MRRAHVTGLCKLPPPYHVRSHARTLFVPSPSSIYTVYRHSFRIPEYKNPFIGLKNQFFPIAPIMLVILHIPHTHTHRVKNYLLPLKSCSKDENLHCSLICVRIHNFNKYVFGEQPIPNSFSFHLPSYIYKYFEDL